MQTGLFGNSIFPSGNSTIASSCKESEIKYLVTILKALMRNITKLKDDFKNNSAPLHCAIEKKRDTNPLFSHQYVSRLQKRQIGAYISQITLKNWQDIFSKLKKIQNFATFICQFYCYP